MRIGITYDLKQATCSVRDGPDDLFEEFDSPATIEAIASALRQLGHDVVKLGDGRELLRRLLADPPDFVFNFAEGHGVARSREARVPAVLEMLDIPYTGSDPLTLAVTLDKDCAKRLVAMEGVLVPRGLVVHPRSRVGLVSHLRFPVIVKPAWEGSSKGIRSKCLVERPDEVAAVVAGLQCDYQQPILVEEFIQGEELTVGVVGNDRPRIIGIMRVVPNEPDTKFVYSLEVKRDFRRLVQYEVPAKIGVESTGAVEAATLKAYRALGCRDVARVDFRLCDGIPYFLEVNPLPGLNPESSDLVILANLAGWTYPQLIEAILEAALVRHQLHVHPRPCSA